MGTNSRDNNFESLSTRRVVSSTAPGSGTRRVGVDEKNAPKWLWGLLVLALIGAAISWLVSTRSSEPCVIAEEEEMVDGDANFVVVDSGLPAEVVAEPVVRKIPSQQPARVNVEKPVEPVPVPVSELLALEKSEASEVVKTNESIDEEASAVAPAEDATSDLETEKSSSPAMLDCRPSFPGGQAAMYRWISEHKNYPAQAEAEGAQGRVVVMFDVDKTGQVDNLRVARSCHPALDKEAMRLVRSMPRWQPGRRNGQPVTVPYTLSIDFRL